jgi:hypothetical protein
LGKRVKKSVCKFEVSSTVVGAGGGSGGGKVSNDRAAEEPSQPSIGELGTDVDGEEAAATAAC